MLALLKRNLFIIVIFIFTILLGFLTFLTFIGKSLIDLSENNLQYLLIANLILLIILLSIRSLILSQSLFRLSEGVPPQCSLLLTTMYELHSRHTNPEPESIIGSLESRGVKGDGYKDICVTSYHPSWLPVSLAWFYTITK